LGLGLNESDFKTYKNYVQDHSKLLNYVWKKCEKVIKIKIDVLEKTPISRKGFMDIKKYCLTDLYLNVIKKIIEAGINDDPQETLSIETNNLAEIVVKKLDTDHEVLCKNFLRDIDYDPDYKHPNPPSIMKFIYLNMDLRALEHEYSKDPNDRIFDIVKKTKPRNWYPNDINEKLGLNYSKIPLCFKDSRNYIVHNGKFSKMEDPVTGIEIPMNYIIISNIGIYFLYFVIEIIETWNETFRILGHI